MEGKNAQAVSSHLCRMQKFCCLKVKVDLRRICDVQDEQNGFFFLEAFGLFFEFKDV